MAESKIKPNPFDPSRFRVVASSDLGGVARKVITHIPVAKPSKQQFVRVHPGVENQMECCLLKLDTDQRPYLVAPEVSHLIGIDIKSVCLRLAIDRQGNVSLWPVPREASGGNDSNWHLSHRQIAKAAETKWIRMVSNLVVGAYEMLEAGGVVPEPTWPDMSFAQLLEIAFGGGHLVETRDHPAIKQLKGEL